MSVERMLSDLERIMRLRDRAEPWAALAAVLGLLLAAALAAAILVWHGGR